MSRTNRSRGTAERGWYPLRAISARVLASAERVDLLCLARRAGRRSAQAQAVLRKPGAVPEIISCEVVWGCTAAKSIRKQ
jgi:hypothetical protein